MKDRGDLRAMKLVPYQRWWVSFVTKGLISCKRTCYRSKNMETDFSKTLNASRLVFEYQTAKSPLTSSLLVFIELKNKLLTDMLQTFIKGMIKKNQLYAYERKI